jgi:co-chaperonin GroES (HSP10)
MTDSSLSPYPISNHGIRPCEYFVLVLPDKVEEKTAGGIIIPEKTRDMERGAQVRGTLVAVGPLSFSYDDFPEGGVRPELGSHVTYTRYAGSEVKGKDGALYRLMKDGDICSVLEF